MAAIDLKKMSEATQRGERIFKAKEEFQRTRSDLQLQALTHLTNNSGNIQFPVTVPSITISPKPSF